MDTSAPLSSAFDQIVRGLIFGPPLWVWPLFVLLLVIGLRASKTRRAPVVLIALLPLLGLLSLRTVGLLPSPGIGWSCFVISYALGALVGVRLQRHWVINVQGRFAQLRGEWLTLAAMMVIFWANFAQGLLLDVAPAAYAHPLFVAGFATALGAAAGSFFGRALFTLRAKQSDR